MTHIYIYTWNHRRYVSFLSFVASDRYSDSPKCCSFFAMQAGAVVLEDRSALIVLSSFVTVGTERSWCKVEVSDTNVS